MSTQPDFNYGKYLASREWALLKEQVRARSQGWCERCAVGKYEETHHLTYERIGKEKLEDLQAVCRACHQFLSGKTSHDPSEHTLAFVIVVNNAGLRGIQPFVESRPGIRIVGTTDSIRFDDFFGITQLPSWADEKDSIVGPQLKPNSPEVA